MTSLVMPTWIDGLLMPKDACKSCDKDVERRKNLDCKVKTSRGRISPDEVGSLAACRSSLAVFRSNK